MSERAPSKRTPEAKLAREVLALQRAFTPRLKQQGKGYPLNPSYSGIGNYRSADFFGDKVIEVRGNLLTEEELVDRATVRIHDGPSVEYRIEVRNGELADVYDEHEKRVEDEEILRTLRVKILRKRLAHKTLDLIKVPLGWYNNPNDMASNQ